jgi:hypothetical protein
LPKLYNGKSKTFWFYAYEANKWGTPQPYTGTVPTVAERRGDFSALLALGSQYQIYDPSSTIANPNGSGYVRSLFPGNIIPAARLSANGVGIMSAYPQPTAGVEGRN